MGSQQRIAGSQQAPACDWVTLRAMEPYFSRTARLIVHLQRYLHHMRQREYILPNISVKAYIYRVFVEHEPIRKPADLVRLFAALADPTRLRLLNLMHGREVCVCYFVEILKQSQPKISRHLAYLRQAGIVRRGARASGCTTALSRRRMRGAASILDAALKNFKSDRRCRLTSRGWAVCVASLRIW